jgi:hypothetical protein
MLNEGGGFPPGFDRRDRLLAMFQVKFSRNALPYAVGVQGSGAPAAKPKAPTLPVFPAPARASNSTLSTLEPAVVARNDPLTRAYGEILREPLG